MATFLKGAVKVFIARENVVNNGYAGTYESALAQDANQLWASDANREFYQIPGVTGVSIGGFGQEFDTFQTLNDAFDHDIEIKEMGSGSCDFIMEYGRTSGATGIALEVLKAMAYYYPNGWNTQASNVAEFDPTDDANVTRATDDRGYAIVIEQKTGDGTNSLYWCFDNCKIGCSISFANRQASRATLTWDDARYVSFDQHTDDGITSGSTVHSDSAAKGF
tara:strand:+ start:3589 stop:4251 length:663 start_codon:yes stop_codon:yes gene_type:complete